MAIVNNQKKDKKLTTVTSNTGTQQTTNTQKTNTGNTAAQNTTNQTAQQNSGAAASGYVPSANVTQAQTLLQQQINNKPGAYESQWQTQVNDTIDRILNREKFSYDVNSDALYQQYKDQYVRQGQQAMADTMGQAAALTGGYGNSYAQTAGQQAYQAYLQQLNDVIPELYQLALDQYNREGEELYNQYGLFSDQEEQDYGRYRDQLSDYYTETDRLTDDYRYAYDMDYSQYRDTVADQQWQAEFDEDKRRYDQEYDLARSNTGSGSGSGSGTGTNPGTDTADQDNPLNIATYDDAVAYLNNKGYNSTQLLTGAEWNNLYAQYQMTGRGSAAVTNYSSYKEYLNYYVTYMLEKRGKVPTAISKGTQPTLSTSSTSTNTYPTNAANRTRMRASGL